MTPATATATATATELEPSTGAVLRLIEHAREMYPHFEDVRGQRDIEAAAAELDAATKERDQLQSRAELAEADARDSKRGAMRAFEESDRLQARVKELEHLLERACGIRKPNSVKWTVAEKERSWSEWETEASAALAARTGRGEG